MKRIKTFLVLLFTLLIVKLTFFLPSNKDVTFKLKMIRNEIIKRGYNDNWFIISGKRSSWYNNLLLNSAKNSHHLNGDAIDIYVFDIDGDGVFTSKDIRIFESANNHVESTYPKLTGALGTYRSKGYLTKHMIHIDTRGYKKRYDQ